MATFLVTFKNADVSGAHDPKVMFNVAHVRGEKSAEGVKSIDEFEINGGYHEMRGIFVYEQLISQHRDTRKLIRSRLPDARIVSNIPVSNSFILMLTKKDLEKVLNMQEVIEVNMNQAFRVDIPVADPLASTDLCDPDSLVSPKSGPLAALPIEKNLQNENENNTEKHLARDILPLNVQWNINKIRANVVWDAYQTQGQGMLYAIADTGVEWTHPNIRQNYAGINGDGTVNHNYAWFDGVRGLVSGGNFIRKEGSYHHGEGMLFYSTPKTFLYHQSLNVNDVTVIEFRIQLKLSKNSAIESLEDHFTFFLCKTKIFST